MPLFTEDQLRERARQARPNISEQELNRDIIVLHLPDDTLIATDEQCAAMYPQGAYEKLLLVGQNEPSSDCGSC